MCVVSMVMDHYHDKWAPLIPAIIPGSASTNPFPIRVPTPAEIAEFRLLLDRAREYDRRHNEPDCELAEKKQRLLDLARELGVDISFIDETDFVVGTD